MLYQSVCLMLVICVSTILGAGTANAVSKQKSGYDQAVSKQANLSDFPRDFAYAMYQNAIARISFGESQSVVEPLYYLAENDAAFADLQNTLAVSIYFGQAIRRQRAYLYASRSVALEPSNDIFRIVFILSDQNQTRMERDGNVVLTQKAVTELKFIEKRLEQGSANSRLLAQILSSIQVENKNSNYPFHFAGFERLHANQMLLITAPGRERFTKLESEIEARLLALKAQVVGAKSKAEEANEWFKQFQLELGTVADEKKKQLEKESQVKKVEYDKWLNVYDQKLAAMTEEFKRLEAFLGRDYQTLSALRVQQDDKYDMTAIAITKPVQMSDEEPGFGPPVTNVVANTSIGNVRENQISVPVALPKLGASGFGQYYALIVGNDKYSSLQNLKTAENDAKEISRVLEKNYGFNVKILLNTTRSKFIGELYKLRGELTANDNLLIYYAGHGYYDISSDRGYWLPIDADVGNPSNWISNSDITDQVRAIQAKHILLVADSCYSGTLTRDVNIRPPDVGYIERIKKLRTRLVITSGGNEPVADSGANGHSVFANALLDTLRANNNILESTDLFQRVRKSVVGSPRAIQVPNFGVLRDADHKGGDFLFIRKNRPRIL